MKNKCTSTLFVLLSAGFLSLQSCQKTGISKGSLPSNIETSTKSAGGGGASGGGHNGGGGGGSVTTADPSLAPTDTTTSQLPVADIITVGRWKVTSFVQGKDNTTSQFANYIFTYN